MSVSEWVSLGLLLVVAAIVAGVYWLSECYNGEVVYDTDHS